MASWREGMGTVVFVVSFVVGFVTIMGCSNNGTDGRAETAFYGFPARPALY